MSNDILSVLHEYRYGGQTRYQVASWKVADLVKRRHDHDCEVHGRHYLLAGKSGKRVTWLCCDVCGRKLRRATPPLGAWVEDGDGVIAKKAVAWQQMLDAERERINQAGARFAEDLNRSAEYQRRREYDTYLRSPAWALKRVKVLARCGGVCEGCRDGAAVEVHHLTYAHFGDELLFELVALCKGCHDKVHLAHSSDDLEYAAP